MKDLKPINIVDENFEVFKKYRKATKILDKVISELRVEEDTYVELGPMGAQSQARVTTVIDVGDDKEEVEYPTVMGQKVANKISTVPDQDPERQLHAIKSELSEMILQELTAYQQFFKSMLVKYGVKSPKELSPEKRKEFFAKVNKAWKAKHEKK